MMFTCEKYIHSHSGLDQSVRWINLLFIHITLNFMKEIMAFITCKCENYEVFQKYPFHFSKFYLQWLHTHTHAQMVVSHFEEISFTVLHLFHRISIRLFRCFFNIFLNSFVNGHFFKINSKFFNSLLLFDF